VPVEDLIPHRDCLRLLNRVVKANLAEIVPHAVVRDN
jgi:hypothetical protein